MAYANERLVSALRATADRLESGAAYQWAHMGACNCGHLAQTLTLLPREEIHRRALERAGDWGEQSLEYCPTSGLPIDDIIGVMLEAGLELRDLSDLERLSGREVLATLPPERRRLERRDRSHVVLYLRAWADLLSRAVEHSGVRDRASILGALEMVEQRDRAA